MNIQLSRFMFLEMKMKQERTFKPVFFFQKHFIYKAVIKKVCIKNV